MTPYIKNQLIKLCDHPEWFNYMLTIWDNNPEEPHTAIRNYLSHVQLFATMTDNTDTYRFVFYEDSETSSDYQKKVCSVDRIPLANFLNEDQGYEKGISMYGHYIACKCLDISSEREYMNQYTDIRILTNELEPC